MRTGDPVLGEGVVRETGGVAPAFPRPPEAGRTGIGWMKLGDGRGGAGGDWRDAPMGGTGARRLAGCGAAR